jgi:uncharacterized C2H2 Zn-finger protein
MSDEWECEGCAAVFATESEYDIHIETAHEED